MMAILLRFWPYIVSIVAIIGLLLLINHWRVEAGKVEGLEKDLKVQKLALKIQSENFIAAKNLTQTVSQKYEDNITKRDADLRRLRNRPYQCVPMRLASVANSTNAANESGKPNIATGVSSSFLVEFAGECETDRVKVMGLQDFINRVYKSNNQ